MRRPATRHHGVRVIFLFVLCSSFSLGGCGWFITGIKADLPLAERPRLALLPWGLEIKITKLASLKTLEQNPVPEEEERLVAQTVQEILDEARWLLQSGVATGQQFRMISLAETDAVVAELGLKTGDLPTPAQLTALKARLEADLVLVGNILDYGKVRWQWLAAGELGDLSAETVVIGLASSWNVPIILGNVGFELLTSTPVWFGGGYLFGAAFRPVRVEARVLETVNGEPVWQDQEAAIYTRKRLQQLSETERGKKELQLYVNLSQALEEIADSLNSKGFTVRNLRQRQQSTSMSGSQ